MHRHAYCFYRLIQRAKRHLVIASLFGRTEQEMSLHAAIPVAESPHNISWCLEAGQSPQQKPEIGFTDTGDVRQMFKRLRRTDVPKRSSSALNASGLLADSTTDTPAEGSR